jgi:spermidine synthase
MQDEQLRRLVLRLFLASGCSGLMYQVVWVRMLSRMFGVTIYATSTVVAAFMAGLALGSYLFGRYVDRQKEPLRLYGKLELMIAGCALLVPLLLAVSSPLILAVANA